MNVKLRHESRAAPQNQSIPEGPREAQRVPEGPACELFMKPLDPQTTQLSFQDGGQTRAAHTRTNGLDRAAPSALRRSDEDFPI